MLYRQGDTDISQDKAYLSPIMKEIEMEATEREDLENMQITKPKAK